MTDARLKTTEHLRVWDLPTRFYHWLQLVLIGGALGLGFFAPEWFLDYHVWIGYGVLWLIVFRLVWGFAGSYYSRFSSFVPTPGRVLAHIRGMREARKQHDIGHNPLGAVMVFALIGVIGALILTGIIALGGVENRGLLAGVANFSGGDLARQIHGLLAYGLVVMIVLHLFGVVFESRLSGISLVRAMIDGKKPAQGPVAAEAGKASAQQAPPWRGIFAFGGSGLLVGTLIYVGTMVPASGFITMPEMESFRSECSDCHQLYHPSLLPRDSWTQMMASLEDHFGEDASLSDETTAAIADYLASYASEAWDSEAANRLRMVDPENPMQISASPFWQETHKGIPEEVFKSRAVRGQSNCKACHGDAESGRFDDARISIPAPVPVPDADQG